ncbi:glycoside hydrolase family 3 C-terminal domain-containing protein [Prevotella sp. E13-17]|uniref:beta-glucosidase n=1 Tax=Prevotella sp. E13-17 TaxID=2913616 RepID=UPI001EDAA58D|nr:glycoside hydrolase family 3 C-terminal domain-containing protein [Prevotella sp. E13-17]UKK51407.1 glycoside hydrolase family 3 C-terminal domain-containing protein [Prevotella sp. E13-17]
MKQIIISAMLLCVTIDTQAQTLPVYLDDSKPMEQRIEDALSRMTLDEKIAVIHAQSKFSAAGVKRLGFPDLWTTDGPHGVRPDVLWDEWEQAGQTNDSCVAFPALTCLAASWNPQMARLYGESLGEEALYRGKHVLLGPGVNINRTPLNGRNFEYMGEDPFLASRMVAPYIQGVQSKGVASCVKHYALNNDEENRFNVNVVVSDRALHEIYLPAFKAAVQQGGAWAIMGAYNLYKNEHCCHNATLLNKILKHDWQFDGVVVSDWGGVHDTEQAVRNGLDMEFGSWTNGLTEGASNAYDSYYLALPYKKLIQQGKFSMKELDEKVRRVLRLYYRTTMQKNKPVGFLCSESHYDAALRIAEEGIVLLKNDHGLLPLKQGKRILVVGENAIKMMTVGGGSSSLKVQKEILPLDAFKAQSATDNSQLSIDYARGYVGDTVQSYNGVTVGRSLYDMRTPAALIAEAVEKAKKADYVVFFGGLNKSDYQDSEGHDRKDYALPYGQNEVIEAILKVNPRLVYVNISGNAVEMPWADRVPAIVQGWFIGSESGEALVNVLLGKANPSGKLPFSWYKHLADCGAHALGTYPGTWRNGEQIIDEEYREDIFVGYRWLEKQNIKPLFAFGHGLSYTKFAMSCQSWTDMGNGTYQFSVKVKNTGKCAGAEVIQLYISDKECSVERPKKELKAFEKVFLQPGESKVVTLTIGRESLSFYDEAAREWRAEAGTFEALIGNSSDNISDKITFKLKE